MRKIIFAILILLGIGFVLLNLSEVQSTLYTMKAGDWRYLFVAFGLDAIWFIVMATFYYSVYHALGLKEKITSLLLLVAASNFVNVVAPTAGVGGLAIFISEAKKKGNSAARVTVAGAVVLLFDYFGFLVILFLGLIVLFRRNHLSSAELIPSLILFVLAIILGVLLFLGMRSGEALGRALAAGARFTNKILRPFIHRNYLSQERAYEFAHDASEGLFLLRKKPTNLIWPAMLGLLNKVILIVILMFTFLAFGVPFSIGTLIGGFSIGYLFYIVSPTPAGIGFVEGALTLGLTSLNVPIGAAALITIAFRGITFWIPLLFGMLAFRKLSSVGEIELKDEVENVD